MGGGSTPLEKGIRESVSKYIICSLFKILENLDLELFETQPAIYFTLYKMDIFINFLQKVIFITLSQNNDILWLSTHIASYTTSKKLTITYKMFLSFIKKNKFRAHTWFSLISVYSSIFKAWSHTFLLVQRERKPGCPKGRTASRHKTSSSPKQIWLDKTKKI